MFGTGYMRAEKKRWRALPDLPQYYYHSNFEVASAREKRVAAVVHADIE